MSREEQVRRHYSIAMMRDACKAFDYKRIVLSGSKTKDYRGEFHTDFEDFNGMRRHLHNYRHIRRLPSFMPPIRAEKDSIKIALREILGTARRTDIQIYVGNQVTAFKQKKGEGRLRSSLQLTVGHMWRRKVWMKFYQKERIQNGQWLVLKADEVRVNHPYIRLYEALVFHYANGETRPAWIGQLKIGDERADIKMTVRQAVEWAKGEYDKETNKTLIGETA